MKTKKTLQTKDVLQTLSDGYSWLKVNGEDLILTPKNEVITLDRYNEIVSFKAKNKVDWIEIDEKDITDLKTSDLSQYILNAIQDENGITQYALFIGANINNELECYIIKIVVNGDSKYIYMLNIDIFKNYSQLKYNLKYADLLSKKEINSIYNIILEYLIGAGLDIENYNEFKGYKIFKFLHNRNIYKVTIDEEGVVSNIKLDVELDSILTKEVRISSIKNKENDITRELLI